MTKKESPNDINGFIEQLETDMLNQELLDKLSKKVGVPCDGFDAQANGMAFGCYRGKVLVAIALMHRPPFLDQEGNMHADIVGVLKVGAKELEPGTRWARLADFMLNYGAVVSIIMSLLVMPYGLWSMYKGFSRSLVQGLAVAFLWAVCVAIWGWSVRKDIIRMNEQRLRLLEMEKAYDSMGDKPSGEIAEFPSEMV